MASSSSKATALTEAAPSEPAAPARKHDEGDVWKAAEEYSSSPAAKAIAESEKILADANRQLTAAREQVRLKFAPSFSPIQTAYQMDGSKKRLGNWLSLVRTGRGVQNWNKYEFRIEDGFIVFSEINEGRVFYKTPVDAPVYGDKFYEAVKGTMAGPLKAEMDRSD